MEIKTPMKRTKNHFSNFEQNIEGLFYKKEKQQKNLGDCHGVSDFIFCDFLRIYQLLNESNLSFFFHFKSKNEFLPNSKQSIHVCYSVKDKKQDTIAFSIEEFSLIMKNFNKELEQIDLEDRYDFHEEIESIIIKHFFKKYNIEDAFIELENQLVNKNEVQFNNLRINQSVSDKLSERIKNKKEIYEQFCTSSPEAIEIEKLETILAAKKKDFEVLQLNKYKELTLKSDKILLKETKTARSYLIEAIVNSSDIINRSIRLPVNFWKFANDSIIKKHGE